MQRGSLVRNRYGFLEFDPKPSAEEMDAMYYESYHSEDHPRRPITPKSEEERSWIRRCLEFRHSVLVEHLIPRETPSMLDIGAGGGWALQYYCSLGWECLGIDLSADSCRAHNPDMVRRMRIAPLIRGLTALSNEKKVFDLVILDNVLEHLPSPTRVLDLTRELLAPGGVAVIEVPNDFSIVQSRLLASHKVTSKYWVSWPEHLQYFNAKGLTALAKGSGFRLLDLISDFPIDLFLFCDPTNYVANPAVGKMCHSARIEIEQLMFAKSFGHTAALYREFANLGLGRNIVAFFSTEA